MNDVQTVQAVCGQRCGPVEVPAGTTNCPQCGHPLTSGAPSSPAVATGAGPTDAGATIAGAPVVTTSETTLEQTHETAEDREKRLAAALEAIGFDAAEAAEHAHEAVAEIARRHEAQADGVMPTPTPGS